MNEKNSIYIHIFSFIAGFICAGIIAAVFYGRSAGEIAYLNRQRNQLNREYIERQRVIEDNQRELGIIIAECIGYAESAGAIIERTSANADAAIFDLRTASAFIRQGIQEREAAKMELHNLRTGLYRLRDMARD